MDTVKRELALSKTDTLYMDFYGGVPTRIVFYFNNQKIELDVPTKLAKQDIAKLREYLNTIEEQLEPEGD